MNSFNIDVYFGGRIIDMTLERRKFIRFDIPLSLEFRPLTNTSYTPGVTINFSREGFCFLTQDTSINLNEILELKIKLPDDNAFIPVVGEIVWKKLSVDKCYAGIRLKEMDKEAKSVILDRAYKIWLESSRQ